MLVGFTCRDVSRLGADGGSAVGLLLGGEPYRHDVSGGIPACWATGGLFLPLVGARRHGGKAIGFDLPPVLLWLATAHSSSVGM